MMEKKKKEVYLTKEKLEKLKKELEGLIKVKRPDVMARIKEARSLGDLKENAEYHSAREEQSFIEGKIEELEYMVKNAKIIAESGKVKNKIDIGCKVACQIEGTKNKREFVIVGSAEVDVASGKISNESPIGMALIGKKVGDVIEVKAPSGTIRYKVLSIS